MIGLGTFNLRDQSGADAVTAAIELGYTHIDTASGYNNEEIVGLGIRQSGRARQDLFVTTKVGRDDLAAAAVRTSAEASLARLQLDYVDLLLIHWPNLEVPLDETLDVFAQLVDGGKVRTIGISNFIRPRVDKAVELSRLPIAVNQVEYHPHLDQEALRQHCQNHGILLTAYSPLAQGAIVQDETLIAIGAECGKSPAQIALRWLLDKQIAAIPKASSVQHMASNIDLFDWSLSTEQTARINAIETVNRVIDWWPGDFDSDE
ncbi:MAG: aldo/keto reductase [Candidatus Latescibacteria bacterium]|nr:aldo/keto reductase [Candidatus Latescibacterota bacterium]